MTLVIEKAIELFGEMQAKHVCHFKQWCKIHLESQIVGSDADEYELVEKVFFPLYEGFESLLDDFIIQYCMDRGDEVEIDEEVINNFITELEIIQCHQRSVLLSLSPENL